MSTKKSYMSLLKEAISEFDTSDHLDVKGPMLDPILSWDGGGELPTSKDAAGILERYYFNEDNDKGVNIMDEGSELEASFQNDKGDASGEAMKNAEGTGTEQAGTSDSDTVSGSKEEKAKDIAKEGLRREQKDEDEVEDEDGAEVEMENAIIEKLIKEMEDEDEDKDEDEDEDEDAVAKTEAEVMNYTGDGPKDEAPKEKAATGPEEDAQGAGTEQAGTGDDEGEIPPRKDKHDSAVKAKEYTDENSMIEAALAELEREISEQEPPSAPDVPEDDEEKDLDVDKEMAKEQAPPPASGVPGGPAPDKEDDDEDNKAYTEAFKLFKEAIEDEDEEDKDKEKEED